MNCRKWLRPLANNKGFTLAELLTVIIIVGILSMLAIPRFMGTVTKAKVTEFKPILRQIYDLEESYFLEHDQYTGDLSALNFDRPDSKYFDYSVEADSVSFTAKATCKTRMKDADGNDLQGEWVSVNEKNEHNGTEKLRKVGGW